MLFTDELGLVSQTILSWIFFTQILLIIVSELVQYLSLKFNPGTSSVKLCDVP